MIISILGRQPELSHIELSSIFDDTTLVDNQFTLIRNDTEHFDIQKLGGTQKAGRVIKTLPAKGWDQAKDFLGQEYFDKHLVEVPNNKVTLGISAYNAPGFVSPSHLQGIGMNIKKRAKSAGRSLRLIPNKELVLNTAVSHHNKLGLSVNKREIFIIFTSQKTYIAESLGAQNITSLSQRDQMRPARDAFVGMLPPKLALMMVNIATGRYGDKEADTVIDPFCGTGVILQEAWIRGFNVVGTDLSDKMIDYSGRNMEWLKGKYPRDEISVSLEQGDAMTHDWKLAKDASVAIACETYLGQPFSAPPRDAKLEDVRKLCNTIVTNFLKNIHSQIAPGTTLCVAVPAWTTQQDELARLPIISAIGTLGFEKLIDKDLIYKREDQVVARDILVLRRRQTHLNSRPWVYLGRSEKTNY